MRLFVALCWLCTPSIAVAAENGSDSLLNAGLKMLVALLLVLGLIVLLYGLSRRRPGLFSPARTSAIKVVETRYLAPKKSLCLVEVGGEEFLLGMGQDRIELISRIDRKKTSTFEEALQARELGR